MPKASAREPMTTQEAVSTALLCAVAVIAMWSYTHIEAIKYWLFNHLISIFIVSIVSLGTILYWIVFRSKRPETLRMNLLSKIWNHEDGIFVGDTYDKCPIHLPDKTRTGHVQIIGATGRGKTESVILPWFMRDLYSGRMPVLIDGKGDREILKKIEFHLRSFDKKPKLLVFDLGNPNESMTINPMKDGTAQQITDRLFKSLEFSDPYYQAVQFDITGSLIELLLEVDAVVTFHRLYSLLTDDLALGDAISRSKNFNLQRKLTEYLARSKKDRNQDTMGVISQLAPFATGELSGLVNGGGNELPFGELLAMKAKDQVAVVILLPTLLYQQMAVKLGKMLLQVLAWSIAARKEPHFTPVFLDEFSAFVYEGFSQILNKARSSGIGLHLCHQSLGDLEAISKGFAMTLNANTNVKCLLGLNDPLTADFFAKHLGTEGQEKVTERAKRGPLFQTNEKTGEMSVREVEAYRVHPNDLKHLMNGEGVLQFAIPEGTILEKVRFSRLEVN